MLDNEGTKIVVCASNTANLSVVHLIRSYSARSASTPACTILEAACACVASSNVFLPVTIGTGYKKLTLIDAHAVCANPAKELLREAQRVFGDDAEAATILSIGSGGGDVWSISGTNGNEIKDTLRRVTTSCEPVHKELHSRLRETSIYFRLNVEKASGSQIELSLSYISAYLQDGEINDKLDDAIKSIQRQPTGVKMKDINSVTVIEIALKPRPSLVQNFVGRQDILNSLRHTHLTHRRMDLTTPAITVLSGLGGSGKTQTALKFTLEFETLYPNAPVYFLNAGTEESLKADYETLIRSLGSENRSKSYKDALRLLTNKIKDWLIILDNADNPRFNIFSYLPKCAHGNIIITTRNSNHAVLAPNSSHHLEGLSTDDAIELVLTASSSDNIEENRVMAKQIVQELGHLPLALAQAAGYIFVHKCLPTYLDLYHRNTRKLLAAVPSYLPFDYPSSVAATIQMSLNQLPMKAQSVLRVFSHFDSTPIMHGIISTAAERQFRQVTWTKDTEQNPQTIQQAEVLMQVFCNGKEWSDFDFNELVNQCLQYSLLRLTTQSDSKFYSMHILVQSYLRALLDPIQGHQPGSLAIRLLGSSITFSEDFKYLAFNRLIAPHIHLIKVEDIVEGGDHCGFGHVLERTGRGKLSTPYLKRCVDLWSISLDEEHRNTLAAMGNLAISYQEAGNGQKAVEIQEKLLEVRMRIQGPENLVTLITMQNLSASYVAVGRYQEALELDEKVCNLWKKVLGPDDPRTLAALGNIARSYNRDGRHQEALELQENLLETDKRILGEDHPDTLHTMSSIAASYSNLGRRQEALDLGQVALEMQTRVLGGEHPHTLLTMHNLLLEFEHFGLTEQLVELLRVALMLHTKALGTEHSDTIRLKNNFKHYIGLMLGE